MTSSAVGERWIDHPLLKHAAGGPLPVEFHLKFVVWNPVSGNFDPIPGATVRVMSGTTVLQAVQGSNTTATDLEAQTLTGSSAGEVTFKGLILTPPTTPPDLHFEISGLVGLTWYVEGSQPRLIPIPTWSTEGWKAIDDATPGKIVKFTGKKLGDAGAPVTFCVGVPCSLRFGYQRYSGESPLARFPSGTRIKIVSVDSNDVRFDHCDFRTDSSSTLRTVLFKVEPAMKLGMLIFTRFVKARDDPNDLVLNPFSVITGNQTYDEIDLAGDVAPTPEPKIFLRYDHSQTADPGLPNAPLTAAGYAFDFNGYAPLLKDVPPWKSAVDTFALCVRDPQGAVTPIVATVEMPAEFGSSDVFSSLGEQIRWRITLCSALHAATLIRELHGLLSSLLVGHAPPWKGLNLDANAFETTLVLTEDQGPYTAPVPNPDLQQPAIPLRGRVMIPLECLFDPEAFDVPLADRNLDRSANFKNIVFHELGHCLMFLYSYDLAHDYSVVNDHLLNRFVNYSKQDFRKVAFWEGWAVFYSMLFMPPKIFLNSQLERIDAFDDTPGVVNRGNLTGKTDADLKSAIRNVFASGLINSYQVRNGAKPRHRGRTLASALNHGTLNGAGRNKGYASEMCLAFSLYSLADLLVSRQGETLAAPAPSDGSGRIAHSGSEWHEDGNVRAALWTAIIAPFFTLKGAGADTVQKLTAAIAQAMQGDSDWHKIKKIFNTYYLMVDPPQGVIVTPSTLASGPGVQPLAITGSGFPDTSSTADDGGLRVEIVCPSTVSPSTAATIQAGLSLAVISHFSVSLTAVLPVAGSYMLKFLGRWDPPVTATLTVT